MLGAMQAASMPLEASTVSGSQALPDRPPATPRAPHPAPAPPDLPHAGPTCHIPAAASSHPTAALASQAAAAPTPGHALAISNPLSHPRSAPAGPPAAAAGQAAASANPLSLPAVLSEIPSGPGSMRAAANGTLSPAPLSMPLIGDMCGALLAAASSALQQDAAAARTVPQQGLSAITTGIQQGAAGSAPGHPVGTLSAAWHSPGAHHAARAGQAAGAEQSAFTAASPHANPLTSPRPASRTTPQAASRQASRALSQAADTALRALEVGSAHKSAPSASPGPGSHGPAGRQKASQAPRLASPVPLPLLQQDKPAGQLRISPRMAAAALQMLPGTRRPPGALRQCSEAGQTLLLWHLCCPRWHEPECNREYSPVRILSFVAAWNACVQMFLVSAACSVSVVCTRYPCFPQSSSDIECSASG